MPSSRTLARRSACLLLAVLFTAPAFARSELFTLTDPRGDDHGDGNYVYPSNEDLDPGDLDLLSVTARAKGDDTLFELTFAKPIRKTERRAIDYGGTQLDTVARLGFYTLNVDLYIDTDRVPGSGGLTTLPGRLADIDPASAWEKAVILTPRPNEARGELKRMLMRQLRADAREEDSDLSDKQADELKAQIPGDVESRIYFPTKVKILGSKISFEVPGSFLGGPAKDTWSYVIAVSGTNLLQSYDAYKALTRTGKEDALMILPVSPGKWQDRFGGGREATPNQPPLIDLVVPSSRKQETVMSDFDRKRPVVLPGVVPAEEGKKK